MAPTVSRGHLLLPQKRHATGKSVHFLLVLQRSIAASDARRYLKIVRCSAILSGFSCFSIFFFSEEAWFGLG